MSLVQKQKRRERLDRGIKVRSESIYALASLREMLYLLAPRLVLILGLLLSPLLIQSFYWQRVLGISAAYALLALSFDFLANYVGLVSLGGALFTGVGAYTAGILNFYLGVPPLMTIPIATLVGAAVSTLILLPVLPLRGVYFAIATLMYPLLFERIIAAANILGGTEGLSGLSSFSAIWIENYLPIFGLFLALFGLRRLVNADIGLVLRAIKDNDQSVRASGLDITNYRARAVFIASAIGCFAGAYLSHLYSWAGMSSFALDFSILPIAATVVGGPGTLAGPVLGSFILSPLSEVLREFGTLRIVFYALVIVLFIVFRSEGVLNYLQRKYEQFEHWVEV
ncbi:MAG TPA: branched-chain amino acid ABC transporter permease [Anaerolineales bacterium]|jgi:branched-chain amino acid transport system permease protein|nr:branched-chain amino acid ABC transporter permease [Anaerolineales bacterium]